MLKQSVCIQIGGPSWDVPTGRRDGRVSISQEASELLPSPKANITSLKQQFAAKGLSVKDLAVLSGRTCKKNMANQRYIYLANIEKFLLTEIFGYRRTHHWNFTLWSNREPVVQLHWQR